VPRVTTRSSEASLPASVLFRTVWLQGKCQWHVLYVCTIKTTTYDVDMMYNFDATIPELVADSGNQQPKLAPWSCMAKNGQALLDRGKQTRHAVTHDYSPMLTDIKYFFVISGTCGRSTWRLACRTAPMSAARHARQSQSAMYGCTATVRMAALVIASTESVG
jgi:hypothetical protein